MMVTMKALWLLLLCLDVLTFSLLSWASSPVLNDAYPSGYGDGSCEARTRGDDLVPPRREVYDEGRIFDISHRLREDMPSYDPSAGPGQLGQFLWLSGSMKNGSLCNFSEMKLPTHTGTHVDAPGHVFDHYFDAGFDIDTLDLAVLNGPALLVDVPRDRNITADVMKSLNIPRGVRRVLFRTLNTDRQLMWKKEFDTSYVGFMKDGAKWLVENTEIQLVGIDYLSVAAFDDLIPSHLVFLESREIILVEALKLDDIKPGIYSVHCLPLRLDMAHPDPSRLLAPLRLGFGFRPTYPDQLFSTAFWSSNKKSEYQKGITSQRITHIIDTGTTNVVLPPQKEEGAVLICFLVTIADN
ncbi:hypothetical protein NE237_017651 [Protea cynaroides]|uniref:Cyclase n=1 Tax=Protea cynaroides TaxID=273540 RepID=A0A9Q0QN75_9MAGN|nr:hypothetical protein NE237_017651 [Protea cynaroides]